MHGLINNAIERFCTDTYGAEIWQQAMRDGGSGLAGFEPMLTYDDALTESTIAALAQVLKRAREDLLEDLGTYLVSHPNAQPLRRLLRFGGVTFEEFLYSLDDLPDRARLAVTELDLPELELRDGGESAFTLTCRSDLPGVGHVFVGILRAMADDYGALVFLEHRGRIGTAETVSIQVVEQAFAEGRRFDLAAAR